MYNVAQLQQSAQLAGLNMKFVECRGKVVMLSEGMISIMMPSSSYTAGRDGNIKFDLNDQASVENAANAAVDEYEAFRSRLTGITKSIIEAVDG